MSKDETDPGTVDMFTVEITDEIRKAVYAELRAKVSKLVPKGREVLPLADMYQHSAAGETGFRTVITGVMAEDQAARATRWAFLRMLDEAEGVELFQPSNGTEGDIFMSRFCYRCAKDDLNAGGDGCPIMAETMITQVDEPDYPREWRQDGEAGPRCTAFAEAPEE